ncbi:hypothetical protein [Methylobacterium sp. Leaf125]|uniref:hypothetical protein n=1 Tax=Methylobacterium sp. Leaf125 TaxID=1736265 RepID=UPI000ADDD395|nr:hypothetical protein [Methylobacterium sp. Leaf125]
MDEKTYAFAIETTAQMEVMRTTVLLMLRSLMAPLPPEAQEEILEQIRQTARDMPPLVAARTGEQTKFYEDVVEATAVHADRFVSGLRTLLE